MRGRRSASRRCASAAAKAWPWSSSASPDIPLWRRSPRIIRGQRCQNTELRDRTDVPDGRGGDAHRTRRAADSHLQRGGPPLVALVHARRRDRTAVTRLVQDGEGLALPEPQTLVPAVVQAAVGPEPRRPGDGHALLPVRRLERLGPLGAEELPGGVQQKAGEGASVCREVEVVGECPVDELVEDDALGAVAAGERDRRPPLVGREERLPGDVAGPEARDAPEATVREAGLP